MQSGESSVEDRPCLHSVWTKVGSRLVAGLGHHLPLHTLSCPQDDSWGQRELLEAKLGRGEFLSERQEGECPMAGVMVKVGGAGMVPVRTFRGGGATELLFTRWDAVTGGGGLATEWMVLFS